MLETFAYSNNEIIFHKRKIVRMHGFAEQVPKYFKIFEVKEFARKIPLS